MEEEEKKRERERERGGGGGRHTLSVIEWPSDTGCVDYWYLVLSYTRSLYHTHRVTHSLARSLALFLSLALSPSLSQFLGGELQQSGCCLLVLGQVTRSLSVEEPWVPDTRVQPNSLAKEMRPIHIAKETCVADTRVQPNSLAKLCSYMRILLFPLLAIMRPIHIAKETCAAICASSFSLSWP